MKWVDTAEKQIETSVQTREELIMMKEVMFLEEDLGLLLKKYKTQSGINNLYSNLHFKNNFILKKRLLLDHTRIQLYFILNEILYF